jgi:hypothetical protein
MNQTTKTMKKSILFLLAVGMFAFTSCGPSAEEKAAAEKAKADSIHGRRPENPAPAPVNRRGIRAGG